MKGFFKNVLANIVAIMIIGALGFFALIMLIAVSAMGDSRKTAVKNNSVLTLDFKTSIIDSPAEDADGLFSFAEKDKKVLLYDMVTAIKNAETDDKIKGISIETDGLRAGMSQLDDVRAALQRFKKSGKFVYAYGNTVNQAAYYLGSVADKYYLNPAGGIDLKGLSSEILYMKDFTDKYGIGLQVIRHGRYKSAVEPFLRQDMSPENREQITVMLQDLWKPTATKIAASRKMDSAQFRTVTDSLFATIPDLSLKYGLVDKLIQKTEYDNLLKNRLQLGDKDKLNKISFSNYVKSFTTDNYSAADQVAVLYAAGEIFNGEGYDAIYSETFVKEINKLKNNKKVKAVVLRVNSPGGSANASDEILFNLQQLKKEKPLVVSFGDYAASGGYYIAMAADRIYSEPKTLTGSIGVFGLIPNIKEMANKNGLQTHAVTTNANSNMYSLFNGMTPGGISILTKSVEQTYRRFVHFVSQNRKLTFEQVDAIAGGRVWSGARAKEIGLVDELGSLQTAIQYAAQKAKISGYEVTAYPKKMSKFEQLLKDMNEEAVSAKILKSRLTAEQYQLFQMVKDPSRRTGVQMLSPYEITLE